MYTSEPYQIHNSIHVLVFTQMTNESPLVRVTTRTCAKRHASRMASIFHHDKNPHDTIELNLTIRLSLTSPWAHLCHTNAANFG